MFTTIKALREYERHLQTLGLNELEALVAQNELQAEEIEGLDFSEEEALAAQPSSREAQDPDDASASQPPRVPAPRVPGRSQAPKTPRKPASMYDVDLLASPHISSSAPRFPGRVMVPRTSSRARAGDRGSAGELPSSLLEAWGVGGVVHPLGLDRAALLRSESVPRMRGTDALSLDGAPSLAGQPPLAPLREPREHGAFQGFKLPPSLQKAGRLYSWARTPSKIVVATKPNDPVARETFIRVVDWLRDRSLDVLVDPALPLDFPDLEAYSIDTIASIGVDAVISIGGDGTLLYVSGLFKKRCPPIMSFNCGSLGFLTPFPHNMFSKALSSLITGPLSLTLRQRLVARICRRRRETPAFGDASVGTPDNGGAKGVQGPQGQQGFQTAAPLGGSLPAPGSSAQGASQGFPQGAPQSQVSVQPRPGVGRPGAQRTRVTYSPPYLCLNEISFDRGYASSMCSLDCYFDGLYFTSVQGDGLLVSTSTGSTAYAISAGGVPVHPDLPVLLFTPVCPHVLSGKQIILPAGPELKIKIPRDARSTAFVSFDSRYRCELERGDSVVISMSPYPVPTVNLSHSSQDWFSALTRCLNWNVRVRQKDEATGQRRWKEIGDEDSG